MENREEIRKAIKYLKFHCLPANESTNLHKYVMMAISALKKQEQTNAQSVNSMRTSRPNALESLNILEQAKDNKGRVPMSLVRQAFRNILEQDKWISCKERLPENKKKVLVSYDTEDGKKVDVSMFDKYGCLLGLVSAWRPLPEPYTEEES